MGNVENQEDVSCLTQEEATGLPRIRMQEERGGQGLLYLWVRPGHEGVLPSDKNAGGKRLHGGS